MPKLTTITAILLCIPVWVHAAPDTTQPAKISEADQKILDHVIPNARFNNNALADAIDFLRGVQDVSIYVDWRSLKDLGVERDASVTFEATGEKFSDMLSGVLKHATNGEKKPTFFVANGLIFISSPDGIGKLQKLAASHEKDGERLVKWLPEVRLNANACKDVLDFLTDVTAMNVTADWPVLQKLGIEKDAPISMRLKKISLATTLQLIALQAGNDKANVDYRVDGNKIEFFAVPIKDK